MAAYLIVDVDDLLHYFRTHGISVDIQELAVGLRGSAALAAGLASAEGLKTIAVADWQASNEQSDAELVFKSAGYDTFDMPYRDSLADALIIHYFSYDPEPVGELILATTSQDLLPVIRRVTTTRNARVRLWGVNNIVNDTEFSADVIFQPLDTLLGLHTKNVAVYIDFENIAISLNEQGFVVNLDHLIDRFVKQAKAHGQVVKMAAYAPWGQRGALPPLVDSNGREVADEAPSRLALANIDPVFNLPGKNSADIRIASDVMIDSGHGDSADVYILASGDRDFNDVLNTLLKRSQTVIIWGVRGSTSRLLEQNTGFAVEYIDDFTNLQTHQSLAPASLQDTGTDVFVPSQWTSVVIQFDRLTTDLSTETVSTRQIIERLQEVGAVVSRPRGEDLVSQAVSLGILKPISTSGHIILNENHPIVDKTRTITDRIVRRVQNTLQVRDWEYINYGFLLKGLAMDRELDLPGCNIDDQWRSHWIDTLVRENILERQLIPHRHNPDDLVPVIKLCDDVIVPSNQHIPHQVIQEIEQEISWADIPLERLRVIEQDTCDMVYRVVVSVEQFTSFRNFAWCPLGSLHRRLRAFDTGMSFQRSVEYLQENGSVEIGEYNNPQSNFMTKGISINVENSYTALILDYRDEFIRVLLNLYDQNMLISAEGIRSISPDIDWDLGLWFSIMETENVLNVLPGRPGQYSLFRTHHTVNLVNEQGHR